MSHGLPVTVTVEPGTSQFFKYDSFSVTCDDEEEGEEEATGWTVMKRMEDGEVCPKKPTALDPDLQTAGLSPTVALFVSLQIHPCPSSCSIIAAFPATDSGAYWCEHGSGETSHRVNITVTGKISRVWVTVAAVEWLVRSVSHMVQSVSHVVLSIIRLHRLKKNNFKLNIVLNVKLALVFLFGRPRVEPK